MTKLHGRLCENEPVLAQVLAGKSLNQKHCKETGGAGGDLCSRFQTGGFGLLNPQTSSQRRKQAGARESSPHKWYPRPPPATALLWEDAEYSVKGWGFFFRSAGNGKGNSTVNIYIKKEKSQSRHHSQSYTFPEDTLEQPRVREGSSPREPPYLGKGRAWEGL